VSRARRVALCAALSIGAWAAGDSAAASASPVTAPRVLIGRVHYEGGGDWYANPSSLKNLIKAVAERTSLPVDRTEHAVTFRDPQLFDYHYLYATGHGTITMAPDEIANLRSYLLRGGFLHVDDNYGLDSSFRIVVKQLFPDRPLVDVPLTHPIYRLLYYTFQADLGNGWEDVGTYPNDPPQLHEQALRMGINLVTYAVTSRVQP
jgi:hypothetical protein